MVLPRQHARDIWDITPASWASTMAYAHQLTAHLREIHQPAGPNVIQSNGTAATQTVWHLHIHLVSRWHGDRCGPIWPA
ncbi:HIT family protein [Frankia sp. Cas3]|uniref:HIT family protein n=1 Tax=Frankia sp. Cas3 TaxID=3073926 RepID=UPI003A1025E0